MNKKTIALLALIMSSAGTVKPNESPWAEWFMQGFDRAQQDLKNVFKSTFITPVRTGEFDKDGKKFLFVELELPGYEEKEIKISVKTVNDRRILRIEAERAVEKETKTEAGAKKESEVKKFLWKHELPKTVKEDTINAKLDKGVLRVEAEFTGEKPAEKEKVIPITTRTSADVKK